MLWALIVIFNINYPAATTVSGFSSSDACNYAADFIKNSKPRPVKTFCIEVR